MARTSRFSPMLIAVALAGCSSGGFVSVERKFGHASEGTGSRVERQTPRVESQPVKAGFHRIEKGDTLYGIAWQYGLNPMDLAASNNIQSPFTIFPGQHIDIRNVRSKTRSVPKPPVQAAKKPLQPATKPPAPKPSVPVVEKKPKPVVVAVPPPVVPSVKPQPDVKEVPKPKPVAVKKPAPAPVAKKPETSGSAPAAGQWLWPAKGKLLAKFSSSEPVNKGVDLAGKSGEPIVSAASGAVVYAGQGLRGYGNLVIIKHDDAYLSAYAHARKILVKESQSIKAGQKIAEIGSTGTDSVKLHFEIRKNGKPVDPLYYLPKR